MRLLYAKSNTLLRTFSHCSSDVKVTLFQSYCTALYCPFLWSDYKKSTFSKIRVASVTRQRLEHSTNTIIRNLYQS